MKIRTGFVSNSSSASFVVSFKSNLDEKEIVKLIKESDSWLSKRWDEAYDDGRPFYTKNNGEFEIQPYTTMFNDWMDVPAWRFIRAISENRIPGVTLGKIIQTQDEYEDCRKQVDFDSYCWEFSSYIMEENYSNVDHETKQKEKKRALKNLRDATGKQEFVNYEYIEYLSNINADLSKEEEVFLVKNHLTKGIH